jgi:hypothetical protein
VNLTMVFVLAQALNVDPGIILQKVPGPARQEQ